jgi:hypothetical protein
VTKVKIKTPPPAMKLWKHPAFQFDGKTKLFYLIAILAHFKSFLNGVGRIPVELFLTSKIIL